MPAKSRSLSPASRLPCARNGDQSGFTLVEVLIAAVIFSMLLVGLYGIAHTAFGLSAALNESRMARATADAVSTRLRSDVEAGRIIRAIDGNLVLSVGADTVRYRWSGSDSTTLLRQVNAAVDTLAGDVVELAFVPRTNQIESRMESVTSAPVPVTAVSFRPGDWSGLLGLGLCSLLPVETTRISGTEWAGVRFEASRKLVSFTSAQVRAGAAEGTPDSDLVLEIYKSSNTAPFYPDTLMAQSRINATDLGPTAEWHLAFFNEIEAATINEGEFGWLVIRGLYDYHTYAGEVERTSVLCLLSDPEELDNGIETHSTDNEGGTWTAMSQYTDLFTVITGNTEINGLLETTVTRADTAGVGVTFRIHTDFADEERALEVACVDL